MPYVKRSYELKPHEVQLAYRDSPHRFNVVPAGRRSGKTERAKRKLVKRALKGTDWDNPRFFAAAPTRDQAKRIFWEDLKLLTKPFQYGKPLEGELKIRLVNGSEIYVIGMDKPQRIEGQPWDGGVLDEYANMKPTAWLENVRPALSDRMGWCDFTGVPEGRNHYYDLYKKAKAEYLELGEDSDWNVYEWVSADILPASEIESARRDLDPLTFQQEYEASFVNFEGQAYYPFDDRIHTARLEYDSKAPLIFTLDFNVAPGTAAIIQEQDLPCGGYGSGVIGEVHIPRNSNTEAVCRKLLTDWADHTGRITVYGDATGGASGTAKVEGSDWDLVEKYLKHGIEGIPGFKDRFRLKVKKANPTERSRVNAMNSRLKSASGAIRMMVDPVNAPNVVKDFEGVKLLKGGSGEIDKKADPELTHLTDGIGYYIESEFPVVTKKVRTAKVTGI